MKKFKLNKKIVIMNIGILIAVALCMIFVRSTGTEYYMHSHWHLKESELIKVTPEFSEDGIIELKDYYLDKDEELILHLKSKSPGHVNADFICDYSLPEEEGKASATEKIETRSVYGEFSVSNLGIIFEHSFSVNFGGYQAVIITLLAVLLMIEAFMLWMFIDYWRKGDFCYPMIACGGMAIFVFITLLFGVYKVLNNVVNTFGQFIAVISEVGNILLLALSPFMFILAVLLAVSNIWLIRHEGFRPVNTLGIIFAVIWVLGTVFTTSSNLPFLSDITIIYSIRRYATYIICYFECMFLSTVTVSFLAAMYKPALDRDYIIILGCAIRSDGTPTPLLRGRADAAAAFEKEQFEKSGKHAVFVPSGGQGSDEIISESESMKNYLISQDIPDERILCEDKSTNTFENMQFSRDVIKGDTDDFDSKKIAFATTNYHVLRGYILAKKNGYEAKGISAKTKFYFFPNAFLREFIGLLADQILKHIFFIAIMLLLFTMLFKIVG